MERHYDSHANDLINLFVGAEKCKKGHTPGPGMRDHHLLHLIEEGKGVLRLEGRTFNIEKGNVFYIPPETLYFYQADNQMPWAYKWIAFDGINAEYYMRLASLSKERPVLFCKNHLELSGVLENLIQYPSRGQGTSLGILALTYRFFELLIHNGSGGDSAALSEKEIYVKNAIQYIQMFLHRKVCVEEVAKYIGIDRSYLCSLFKEKLGISPQRYIIGVKMERAKEYLLHTNFDIKMIAGFVGYDDQFLFSRIFKKTEGLSPRKFRERERAGKEDGRVLKQTVAGG